MRMHCEYSLPLFEIDRERGVVFLFLFFGVKLIEEEGFYSSTEYKILSYGRGCPVQTKTDA